jgi:hypothetical protein
VAARPQLGLTTALGVLKRGFVLVGSVPTLDGTSGTVQAPGSLLILDRFGNVVNTLSDSTLLDGPWDLTINDQGAKAQVFVSNVLSGTVTRIDLKIPKHGNPIVESETQIASGYLTRTDPAALLVGPTGLAYDAKRDILYVASTGDNEIFAISDAKDRTSDAGMGKLIYQDATHLHGPLGLVLAPNGDLISSQGDAVNSDPTQPSELVEFTPEGRFVAQMPVDSSGQQGGAFGIALQSSGNQINFAAVDDIFNTLEVWTINTNNPAAHKPADHADVASDAGLSVALGSLQADVDTHPAVTVSTAAAARPSALPTIGGSIEGSGRPQVLGSGMMGAAQEEAVDRAFADFTLSGLV